MTLVLTKPALTRVILRTQSDERLVAFAREGHERAFETIFNRYRPELTRSLRRYLPPARIDDVLQQALINAWQAFGKRAEIRDLQPWLHRVARNAALNDLKRPGYDHAELHGALQFGDGPEGVIEQRDIIRRTLAGVAALPDRQRAALLAIAVEGRPSQEVADELGISDPAARQLLARARATLRAGITAATPSPLLAWALQTGHAAAVGEGVAGAALGAGGVATVVKAGALLTAGVLAVSGPVVIERHVAAANGHEAVKAASAPARPDKAGRHLRSGRVDAAAIGDQGSRRGAQAAPRTAAHVSIVDKKDRANLGRHHTVAVSAAPVVAAAPQPSAPASSGAPGSRALSWFVTLMRSRAIAHQSASGGSRPHTSRAPQQPSGGYHGHGSSPPAQHPAVSPPAAPAPPPTTTGPTDPPATTDPAQPATTTPVTPNGAPATGAVDQSPAS
jgi:RNA polymerase sigma factor (sigma-70 family)